MRIIVLEGPDKTYKTTVAKKLCETHNVGYVKGTACKSNKELRQMGLKLLNAIEAMMFQSVHDAIIVDRMHFFSEPVFNPNMTTDTWAVLGSLESKIEKLKKQGAVFTTCFFKASPDVILGRMDADGGAADKIESSYADPETMGRYLAKYEYLFRDIESTGSGISASAMQFDTDIMTSEDIVQAIHDVFWGAGVEVGGSND